MTQAKIICHRFLSLESLYGKGLRNIRKTLGLTQKELAALTGICCSSISNIENDRQDPTVKTMIRVRDALLGYIDSNAVPCVASDDMVVMTIGLLRSESVASRGARNKKLSEF
ncbi:MAG: helix-turn-helix transcriptional regulator [Methanocellales archaeon]|nr:helix-turn-helix transcriptional regulator [Methanocellales archaeon]MDD3291571.1 helix-turn-helix transcriptional regulator [Methanocellales archaeon]MDD5235861.1 helix-turn-helix transcriptional regulator [Methanocellales archaeon]MDD5485354.1 helix-turn-helix transcriptional regulator [Methanocellales archaeon]